jgi:hypothetical protein
VHNFVAEQADEECTYRDDEDTSETRDIVVHRVNQLGSDNAIDSRPSDTGQYIEDGDEFNSVPAKPKS